MRPGRGRAWKSGTKWTRLLHVYTSMVALVVILFFGATGVTLNHPEWTFGAEPVSDSYSGTLPEGSISSDGTVEFLVVSEYLRDTYGVDGTVDDFGTDVADGYISYREPGYAADVFFDLDTGEFRLSVEQQGWIGVLNELHRGRNAGSSWSWLIDASGIFLVVVAITGLGLQLFLAKRRRSALIWATVGGLAAVAVTAATVL